MTVALHAHSLPTVGGGKFARVLLPHITRWCNKIEYDSEQDATRELLAIWANKVRLGRYHRETRCYQCPRCRAWHLTSKGDLA